MARILQLRVVTPERSVYQGDADFVVVPAHDGEIGILPRHARSWLPSAPASCAPTAGGNVQRFFVEGGVVQVRDDRVTVLCDRHAASRKWIWRSSKPKPRRRTTRTRPMPPASRPRRRPAARAGVAGHFSHRQALTAPATPWRMAAAARPAPAAARVRFPGNTALHHPGVT
jgi:F-type H+-transporting ATPase subunit epsilon